MLKIFLVEDEVIVREGIKRKINWEEYGFIFVGEASDGELAYPLIQKTQPDIIITDIRMPFMDGLELSRLVRKEMPRVKIIILSGYDEFSYAKEAINIGVTEYLLKPVSSAKIIETILMVKKIIEDERHKNELVRRIMETSRSEEKHILSMPEDTPVSIKTLDTTKIDKKIMERFLKSGSCEDADQFVEDYFDSLGDEHTQSFIFRQYIAMDIHLTAVAFLEELGVGKKEFVEKCGDIDGIAASLSSLSGTKTYLKIILEQTLKLRDCSSGQKYGELLSNARDYIQRNYSDESVSLNQVARSVNISPTHFSMIFSQETGQTFIEYLTAVRMEKAKELLRCSSMKSSEIAYAVGYKDPHYFSYSFKKMQGCTPKEFRAGKAAAVR